MAREAGARESQLERRLKKTVEMALLYDRYGELLTEKQRRFFELYFLDDLSLGEISDQYGVSRQAVYDILRRSQRTLERMESTLGLVAARRARAGRLAALVEVVSRLEDVLADPGGDRGEARQLAAQVKQGLVTLGDLGEAPKGGEANDGLRTAH